MTGIDYKGSELSIREKFAVGKENSKTVIAAYMSLPQVNGCVIISTCNRTEIYVSIETGGNLNIADFLCKILNQHTEHYISNFTERDEAETFFHLCKVASGAESQILGDDQIITQVREALEVSRDDGFTDSHMETFFRTAIKAAKEIKTKTVLRSAINASAPYKAVEKLQEICSLSGKKAVVIGNGQMGRLASQLLLDNGVHVTATLREYKKGVIKVPLGADTINYSKRYDVIKNAHIVVSATTSPHYTLHYDDFYMLEHKPEVIVDLAVPRDVEPTIGNIKGIKLFTIDDLGRGGDDIPETAINIIINDNMKIYHKWKKYKESLT